MFNQHPTLRYILARGGWYFLTFLVAITINFFLPRLGPANPVDIILAKSGGGGLSDQATREKEEAYLKEFALAELDGQGKVVRDGKGLPIRVPLFKQFVNYLGMCLRGDLGTSFNNYPKKVTEIIRTAVPWTIALQLPTIVLAWFVGNILGALAAYRRGIFDKLFFPAALGLNSIPFFAFGMLIVYLLGIFWRVFPAVGGYDAGLMPAFSWTFFGSALYHYILPFFSIFLICAGGQAIGMRSMCIYELGTDYVKYAKWLGITETRVLFYMFRNAMLPQLTGLALSLGMMIGGALITEMIFSYPGIGMSVLTAIQTNDYPLIQGCTLLITVSVLVANFTVDILIGFLDPRVKAGQGAK